MSDIKIMSQPGADQLRGDGMNEKNISSEFEQFMSDNRRKINESLNSVLWICIGVGPLIALAVYLNFFQGVTYLTALLVSLFMLILAMIHKAMLRSHAGSVLTSMLALLAIDVLLVVMDSAHLTIFICWFLIPLLSLEFCDFKLYSISVVVNYCFMVFATWHMAPYFAERRNDVDTALAYFLSRIGGLTLEMFVMIFAGYVLSKMIISYYKNLIEKAAVVSKDQMEIGRMSAELTAMAGDYLWVQDIDVKNNCFVELCNQDEKVKEYYGESNSNAKQLLNGLMTQISAKESREDVLAFVNFDTLQKRMGDTRFITHDFKISDGRIWQGRLMVSERDEEGKITHVIWSVKEQGAKEQNKEMHSKQLSAAAEKEAADQNGKENEDAATQENENQGADDLTEKEASGSSKYDDSNDPGKVLDLLHQSAAEKEKVQSKIPANDATIKRLLSDIQNAAENMDCNMLETAMKEADKYSMPLGEDSRFERLKACAEHFDYDGILKAIEN